MPRHPMPRPRPFYVTEADGKMITIKTNGVDTNAYLLEARSNRQLDICFDEEW